MKEKIVEGRLKKKFEENVLMGQKWIKNEDITVEQAMEIEVLCCGCCCRWCCWWFWCWVICCLYLLVVVRCVVFCVMLFV
ncbi:unnamed protein product [Polarella glacialis]|uniref:Translation elongation factor EFTs/EF1B dimerisation domain-containing protein n=1 Tax=Polarella glacialis TaxID=89957 RepID=A0A813DQ27_POLGL|nr:unnamed protein product [Polarella glacialis]